MTIGSLYHTYKRYRSLQTDRISSLPLVILMPHSACNCRCVMCDIWKGNQHLKQLEQADIESLLGTLRKLGTQQVLMSGGEALLNPLFFRFCELLKEEQLTISLLSTGLTLKKHAAALINWVDDIIVSLDGDEALHNTIRNIPHAFRQLAEGIAAIHSIQPDYPISCRTVVHRLNYRHLPAIIDAAKKIGLNSISFLPADVSSTAFNRSTAWGAEKQQELLVPVAELPALQLVLDTLMVDYSSEFRSGFIVESPLKMQQIHDYYAAHHGLNEFPRKKCNAPWVAAVVEADGNTRPCFFHDSYGNIKLTPLDQIINSREAVAFRKNLDMNSNETCKKCVCYLHLSPLKNFE